jgi:hypothetical protein
VLLDAREARKLGRTRTALNIPLMPQRAWCSQSLNSALAALTASSARYETPQVPEENTLWILEESGTSSLSNVMACHVFPVFPVFPVLSCPALSCLALSGWSCHRRLPSFSSVLLVPTEEFETARYPIPGAMAHTHVSKQLLNGCVLFPRFSLSRTFGAPSVNVSICSGACASFLGHLGFQQTRSQHFCGVAAVWRPSPGETSKQAVRSVAACGVRSAIAQRAPDFQ